MTEEFLLKIALRPSHSWNVKLYCFFIPGNARGLLTVTVLRFYSFLNLDINTYRSFEIEDRSY